jgi:hypothetical protein
MSGIAVAVGSAVAGIAGSAIQASAAKSAASTQAQAAEQAMGISENQFNTIQAEQQPYMQAGYGALGQLSYLQGIGTPGSTGTASSSPSGGYGSLNAPFTAGMMEQYSPAYQFQLQQGQAGTLNSQAQGALSGAALQNLSQFNQNYANTAFYNAFNQYQTQQQNTYNRLSGIANLGETAAGTAGGQGTTLAGQAAQSATNIGTAQAAGTIGAANAAAAGLQSAVPLALLSQNAAGGVGNSASNVVQAAQNANNAALGYDTGII